MTIAVIAGLAVFFLFALVVFRGAPYVPTLKPQVEDALALLDLKPGQTLLDLGSGDGRLLHAAAKQGIYAVGYELNPLLVAWTKARYWRWRKYITVKWGDYWLADWPASDGMYVFLNGKFLTKLDNKVVQYTKNRSYKLVSFAFEMPNRSPAKIKKGLRLYLY